METIDWVEVDPGLASEMLASFTANRKSSEMVIGRYARLMQAGKWYRIGEPICISEAGKTMNGMHRLKAVIASGCTVALPVIWGVPEEAMMAIDTGTVRTYANVRQIMGDQNANVVAAVTRRLWFWDRGEFWLGSSQGRQKIAPAHTELDAYLKEHQEIPALVKEVKSCPPPFMPVTTGTVCRIIMARRSAEDEERFWAGWSTGADLSPGSPVLALRERLTRDADLRARHDASEVKLVLACLAWNGFRKRKPMVKLQLPVPITNERYPVPS